MNLYPADSAPLRRLIAVALIPTSFGLLHHADHILREATGWPLTSQVTPFTFSLGIYLIVLPGIVLSRRGFLGPGFWAAVAVLGLLIVVPVHFGPVADDSPAAICRAYQSRVVPSTLALVILGGLVGGLIWLLIEAFRTRRLIGRW